MSKIYIFLNFFLALLLLVFLLTFIQFLGKRLLLNRKNAQARLAQPSRNFKERRQHERFEVDWKATVEADENRSPGEIKNISLGGAFVICAHPLPLEKAFRLTIEVPGRQPIAATAQVVWSNSNVPEDQIISRGMGVRFLKISKADRGFIRSLEEKSSSAQ